MDFWLTINCFDGVVISWSVGEHSRVGLVNTMLDAAIETVADCTARPNVRFFCGVPYRWRGWRSRIGNAKRVRSMSGRGCSLGKVACEGFFGWLKTELFFHRNFKATTVEQFIKEVNS